MTQMCEKFQLEKLTGISACLSQLAELSRRAPWLAGADPLELRGRLLLRRSEFGTKNHRRFMVFN